MCLQRIFREGKSQKWIDFFSKQCPSNRLGVPEDVAPLVAFLSSPAVQRINGQNIRVNGVSLMFLRNAILWLMTWIGFRIVIRHGKSQLMSYSTHNYQDIAV